MKLIFVHAATGQWREQDALAPHSSQDPRLAPFLNSHSKMPCSEASPPTQSPSPPPRHSAPCWTLALSSIPSTLESDPGQHQTARWLQGSYSGEASTTIASLCWGDEGHFCPFGSSKILSPRSSRLSIDDVKLSCCRTLADHMVIRSIVGKHLSASIHQAPSPTGRAFFECTVLIGSRAKLHFHNTPSSFPSSLH